MNKRRNRREGFTLMEILLVAAILVILASMATLAFRNIGARATANLALSEIGTFENASEMFATEYQRLPNSLDELFTGVNGGKPFMKDGDKLDPWGNEYKFEVNSDMDMVIIRSAGPDGQYNTDDDVSNDPRDRNQQG